MLRLIKTLTGKFALLIDAISRFTSETEYITITHRQGFPPSDEIINHMLYPVILSGGTGTRLWPVSRKTLPKQLLPLVSEKTLFQDTLLRLQGMSKLAAPVIICNNEHRFLIAEQLRETGVAPQAIFLEPIGRNTAPAVAIAALHLAQLNPDALMLILPSDHYIDDIPAFHKAVEVAAECARKGYLVTFGIQPSAPETGFGYIQRGDGLAGDSLSYKVARFVEKPDAATAESYLQSGDYFWNSGMFLFSASRFIEELEKYAPSVLDASKLALEHCYEDLDFYRIGEEQFSTVPSISIDYAVMEKTDAAAVVPSNIGWSDVGSWSALWEHGAKDKEGNVARGETILHETKNSYVLAQHRLVATTGVQDIVVVETPDAVLVAHKDASQDVKAIVDKLKEHGRTEHETHRKVYRPWGSYEGMDRGERFQVKRIIVNPGAKLSLQMHHHRAEHWIVVSGIAEVTVDDTITLLHENQSIYIPLGSMHRLHNPGRIPLHLIEVQSGSYLGEDDIVRTEDIYGRSA